MKDTELLSKSAYLLDRLEKAAYMGFLLDKHANDYLNQELRLNFNLIENYIENYNTSLSKKGHPINLVSNREKSHLEVRHLGEFLYVKSDNLSKFMEALTVRIKNALKSDGSEGIEIYDLDLLVPLKRTGITTMGDTYLAYNRKKYTVHFSHLWSIIDA